MFHNSSLHVIGRTEIELFFFFFFRNKVFDHFILLLLSTLSQNIQLPKNHRWHFNLSRIRQNILTNSFWLRNLFGASGTKLKKKKKVFKPQEFQGSIQPNQLYNNYHHFLSIKACLRFRYAIVFLFYVYNAVMRENMKLNFVLKTGLSKC